MKKIRGRLFKRRPLLFDSNRSMRDVISRENDKILKKYRINLNGHVNTSQHGGDKKICQTKKEADQLRELRDFSRNRDTTFCLHSARF